MSWKPTGGGSSRQRARRAAPWAYHPQAFATWSGHASPGGAEMAVYDVNGDARNDVVTVLQAHGLGMAWFEQKRDSSGEDHVRASLGVRGLLDEERW